MKLRHLLPCWLKNVVTDDTVSYFRLFIFATLLDKIFILIATLCSILCGCILPFFLLFYADMIGSIISYVSHLNDSLTDKQILVLNDGLWKEVKNFSIKVLGLSIIMIICKYLAFVLLRCSANNQILKMREKFLESMLNQDIEWFDMNQTNNFTTIFSENISKIEDGIGEKISLFLYFTSSFVCGFIIALYRGWKLTLVSVAALPLSFTIIGILTCLSSAYSRDELHIYGAAGAVAEEVLTAIKTVAAFDGQEKEVDRFNHHLNVAKKINIRKSIFISFSTGFVPFFNSSNLALIFWYGIKLIIEERNLPSSEVVYKPGDLVAIYSIILTVSSNFGTITPLLQIFGNASSAAEKVFLVLNSKPHINKQKKCGIKPSGICSSIIFENVYFSYPSRPDVKILQDFNLEINYGDTVALVGSSGCGKSTSIQLLQRFYDPVLGNIFINNNNLKDINLSWLKEKIGVVGQEPVLFGTTIFENIRYGKLNATQDEIEEAAKKSHVHNFILSLPQGYQTVIGESGAQLSGGQKQRIAIARALVKNPEILLLDEATSALDTTSEAEVQAALEAINGHCITIIVAHRLSTIRNANIIVFIDKGKVVEKGTHAELIAAQGYYYKMVSSQNIKENDDSIEHAESNKILTNLFQKNITHEVSETAEEEGYKIGSYFLKLLKISRPEWFYILIGCITSVINGSSLPLTSSILGGIFAGLAKNDTQELRDESNLSCLYLLLIGVVCAVSAFIQTFFFSIVAERLCQRMREKSFKALLYQDMGWYDKTKNGVGALCAQLSGDAADLQGATGNQIGVCFNMLTTFLLTCIISIYYQWKLALVLFCFSPIILFSIYYENTVLQDDSKEYQKLLKTSAKIAVEAVSNIRTVTSLACEEEFQKLYTSDLMLVHKSRKISLHLRGLIFGISKCILSLSYLAGISYGVKLIVSNEVKLKAILKVLEVVILGSYCLGNVLTYSQNLQTSYIAAGRIFTLIERIPLIKNVTQPYKRLWQNEKVDYSDVYFSYPNRPSISVLRHLNLSIMKGTTVALVGSSGCGKSTIIQLLQRFYDPNYGTVKVEDLDIKFMDLQTLRSQLGLVSQEPSLFDRTIAENIAYGANHRNVTMDEIIEAAKSSNIHNFINSLPMGYETRIGIKGTQLSGGQKQRIAIARALIRNPKILLLDEATSALDNESELIVQEALDKAKMGRTCIIIAHRLTTIQDADVICVLKEGSIEEMGTHTKLMERRGLYYNFYKLQCGQM